MTPAVTVVIPCFNLGAYLDEAVSSVLRQTYEDYEIVIVDDGSDEEATRLMLATYERPRTRVLRTPNRGVARARNAGLAEARGHYVSFLDPDDTLDERFLERTIGALEQDEAAAFASCWLTAFGEQQFSWEPDSCDFPWLLAEDTVCTAAPVRRRALEAIGGFDPAPEIDGYEDWELAVSLVAAGHPGLIVPEHLFRYRIRAGSKSSDRTRPDNHRRVFEYMLEKHADLYAQHSAGVIEAIEARTADLERLFDGAAPPRPSIDRDDWRGSILALESHRRGLEEQLAHRAQETEATAHGGINWGSLRRLEPVSRVWGLDRGRPVDRYYIERFLEGEAEAISGDVLEVKDPVYAKRFGATARSYAAVDIAAQNPEATLLADLSQPEALAPERFDCFVITQTIHIIYDVAEVVRNVHRCLRPGGVGLATLPCVSRIDYESGVEGDFWRFTAASAKRLFESEFGEGNVQVESFGNLLACTAFLHGMAVEDLDVSELEQDDPYFPLLIGVRAEKAGEPGQVESTPRLEGHLDEATCLSISGWGWDAGAPEKRRRVKLTVGDRELGTAWCDEERADLTASGRGDGRVAFRFRPPEDVHANPQPATVSARIDGHELVGSPMPLRCVCGRAAVAQAPAGDGLRAADLDSPRVGETLTYPQADIVGWVVGEAGPIESVELLQRGEPFRTVPVDRVRPDLEDAFSDVAWSGRSGFFTRLDLAGTGGELDLEIKAVLEDGRRATVARVTGQVAEPPGVPVVGLVDEVPESVNDEGRPSLLRQRVPLNRILVRRPSASPSHPGFQLAGTGWNEVLEASDDALFWLGVAGDAVSPGFLGEAIERLAVRPDAAFASAVTHRSRHELASVLGATALGRAVVFRVSAARLVGGIDSEAESTAAAAWDLAIRLVEAGHEWVEIEDQLDGDGDTLAAAAGETASRRLYRKHESLFARHLRAVLLEREQAVGELLRSNHLAERRLESDARRRLRGRRSERDRLAAKLRTEAGEGGGDPFWGDFRRFDGFSPMWGSERGTCIDRWYVERFLERHSHDIHGVVLSSPDSIYAERYGGERLTRCDVFDPDPTNPDATLVTGESDDEADLPADSYDCVLLTHVLQHTYEVESALAEFARVLKPGGVALVTVPGLAQIDADYGIDHDHWRFSGPRLQQLLSDAMPNARIELRTEGSPRAALAFLAGLAAEELVEGELDGSSTGPLAVTARVQVPAS